MIILGIETSCDETSVAVVKNDSLAANLISSQYFHKNYGGVVPELSSRAHLQIINPLVKSALEKSSIQLDDIDIISATAGPGLIGALLVGLTYAKGLSLSLNKKFVAVNHIEGHIFSGFLMKEKPEFPFICLVVSGGHTLLLLVKSFTEIYKLGSTVDDAAGEAFDKVSKLIGLGYPGGPKIQKAAEKGDPNRINFPIAELKEPYNFSFSGLKTAVLRYVQQQGGIQKIDEQHIFDIAASFQSAVIKALIQKLKKAIGNFDVKSVSIVGGVAANSLLKEKAEQLSSKYNLKLVIPSLEFCGDNAAMIAFRAKTLFENGITHDLNYKPYPSLDENSFLSL
ncbi:MULTISPECIES: tRNA (adenosine(37)-N6)-threonylcarbamoyltransferase complex transferase subunit TsaD [Ignavibacterium]|jgi:N6-L-threonylcarbamoyladenine synthase|uniref:tRNA (adenosine(37)-N6)-threonylcarbamoyltransferase complex transferase subunit TsaD n=1 Tax=Ignavibacterium TaxID=795750 RepID=UPI0025C72B95|nr:MULTISPECIES: tRNA (adenosine(37)-N6)-threonylcarbamoyltransferase complex transferase subunit TsaD [Ignavibacterium]MBI5663350.1 tRNA (adenosine(37)-N6)-threonylcarbamoyltransferase complex transferase subunit TsaD [Ignavibacterium album]